MCDITIGDTNPITEDIQVHEAPESVVNEQEENGDANIDSSAVIIDDSQEDNSDTHCNVTPESDCNKSNPSYAEVDALLESDESSSAIEEATQRLTDKLLDVSDSGSPEPDASSDVQLDSLDDCNFNLDEFLHPNTSPAQLPADIMDEISHVYDEDPKVFDQYLDTALKNNSGTIVTTEDIINMSKDEPVHDGENESKIDSNCQLSFTALNHSADQMTGHKTTVSHGKDQFFNAQNELEPPSHTPGNNSCVDRPETSDSDSGCVLTGTNPGISSINPYAEFHKKISDITNEEENIVTSKSPLNHTAADEEDVEM